MIEITSLSASFPRGWAERKGAGHCEEQRFTMYVSLHSPASAAAYASCRVTLPSARREGLYLFRATARKTLFGWAGGTFLFAPQAPPYFYSETADGRECRSGGQQAREFTTVGEQAIARTGVRDRLPRARRVLLRRAAAGVGAYLGRRSPVGQGGVRDHPRMRVSAALCTLAEHVARISGIICRPNSKGTAQNRPHRR